MSLEENWRKCDNVNTAYKSCENMAGLKYLGTELKRILDSRTN